MQFLWHPLVVHFPVALWLTSLLFDLVFFKTQDRFFATTSRYLMGLGVLGAGVAMGLGFVDLTQLVAGGVGQALVDLHQLHSKLAYVATTGYTALFLARWRWRAMPPVLSVGLAILAAALITATAWFGGEIRRVM
jgi:uncharacterized membrane protein